MKRRFLGLVTIFALALAACGSEKAGELSQRSAERAIREFTIKENARLGNKVPFEKFVTRIDPVTKPSANEAAAAVHYDLKEQCSSDSLVVNFIFLSKDGKWELTRLQNLKGDCSDGMKGWIGMHSNIQIKAH